MGLIKSAIAMSVAILVVGHACAEVTDSEAKALGTTLTAFGADPKASADGLVPAYTGEPIKPTASYKEGSGRFPDPFSSEKPVVSITQKNMAEYSDKLTEGTKELLKRYPDFRVDVFPSHRTMVYPQRVLETTKELARAASPTGSDNLKVEERLGRHSVSNPEAWRGGNLELHACLHTLLSRRLEQRLFGRLFRERDGGRT